MGELKGLGRVMMAMAAAGGEVFVAEPREKRAVAALEKRGLVSVRRTAERCAGFEVWYFAKKGG
jgi:hypothetical protein